MCIRDRCGVGCLCPTPLWICATARQRRLAAPASMLVEKSLLSYSKSGGFIISVVSGVSARRLYGFVLLPGRDAWQHQQQCFGGRLPRLFQQARKRASRKSLIPVDSRVRGNDEGAGMTGNGKQLSFCILFQVLGQPAGLISPAPNPANNTVSCSGGSLYGVPNE